MWKLTKNIEKTFRSHKKINYINMGFKKEER